MGDVFLTMISVPGVLSYQLEPAKLRLQWPGKERRALRAGIIDEAAAERGRIHGWVKKAEASAPAAQGSL